MRGPLPLNDADFAAVRANVLSRIAQRRQPYGWLLAFAASVVVAVLSFVAARQAIVVGTPLTHFTPVAPQVARSELRVASPAAHTQHATRKPQHHTPRRPPTQLARIEIHTADPDIRIIWITHQEAP